MLISWLTRFGGGLFAEFTCFLGALFWVAFGVDLWLGLFGYCLL